MSGRTTTKPKPAERGTRGAGMQNLVRDTAAEIRKVTWPDSQTTRNLTMLVIGMAAALGIILGGIDAIFIRIWDWIPN
jgi:preprotein translocase subunit SecE